MEAVNEKYEERFMGFKCKLLFLKHVLSKMFIISLEARSVIVTICNLLSLRTVCIVRFYGLNWY